MIQLAINGTLMRGLELNQNLIDVDAEFIREDKTQNCYRLFSINDIYPAMFKDTSLNGNNISLEIWELDGDALTLILKNEPPGLCMGKVELADGSTVLGVLGETYIFSNQKEITGFGGWKEYLNY